MHANFGLPVSGITCERAFVCVRAYVATHCQAYARRHRLRTCRAAAFVVSACYAGALDVTCRGQGKLSCGVTSGEPRACRVARVGWMDGVPARSCGSASMYAKS